MAVVRHETIIEVGSIEDKNKAWRNVMAFLLSFMHFFDNIYSLTFYLKQYEKQGSNLYAERYFTGRKQG